MAGKMEGGDRRFSVAIELGASAMFCTAYFENPDRITYCAICGCIPDVLHILDNDAPLCKRCFRRAVGSNPLKGSSETVTPQPELRSVTCNEAFRDAFVTCPGCRGTGRYVEFKAHIRAAHPHLWHCGQLQQANKAQMGNEIGRPPGFESQHQAAVKEGHEDSTQTSAGTGRHTTEQRVNCDSYPTEGITSSGQLDHQGNEDTMSWRLESQRWFEKQLLKYYELHLQDSYLIEGKDSSYFENHIPRCPMVSPMHGKWFSEALSKYKELQKKQRLGCNETCSNFMEHAIHSKEFFSEVKAVSTNEMFGYYQEHANGCPRNSHSKDTTQNRSSSEPMEHEEETKQYEKPSSAKSEELSEYHQCKQTNAQEHLEAFPQSPEADIGGKNQPPADITECLLCFDEWDCQEIQEHIKHRRTYRLKCSQCDSKVALSDYQRHHDHDCPGNKQRRTNKEEGLDHNPKICKTDDVNAKKPATQLKQHSFAHDESYKEQIELLQKEIRHLKQENKELRTTVQKLGSSEEKNQEAIAKLQKDLESTRAHQSKVEDLITKQSSQFETLKNAFEDLAHGQRKNEENTQAENSVRNLKTELHMDLLLPVFQHIWKLQPYSALRKSLLFNNATLSTGVLSVNTPGYKIELMLSIRGDYREWRRQQLKDESSVSVPTPHLALMLRIHQGEHDDLLAWPFTNKITLLLVNHHDENKSKLLELGPGDGDGDWLKKPVRGVLNPLFGISRVISLLDLENGEEGFLFQDCIVFKITVHRRV